MEEELFLNIKKAYDSLRASEKKVADYILTYYKDYLEVSMSLIATEARVSQPTIMRFVKALGYSGFTQFKYQLIRQQKTIKEIHGYTISREDTLDDIPAKIIQTTVKMLEDTLQYLHIKEYKLAVERILQAKQISIYSVENSNCVAQDLMTKLLYLGISCRYYDDYYLQSINASTLDKEDLAIAISYSGNSKNTVEVMRIAKKRKAKTMVLTNKEDAMLKQYGDIMLYTHNEQNLYGNAIFSRTTQLSVVDMLYMGILISDYDMYSKRIDNYSKLIEHQGYLKEE